MRAERHERTEGLDMYLIVLEALAALVILVGIVWWTMFSGRKGGELDDRHDDAS